MAIFVDGMKCSLCGAEMHSNENNLISFPPFVPNTLDPLYLFSDATFHTVCFNNHALAERALNRLDKLLAHSGREKYICAVCGQRIESPDDFLALGHLSEDKADSLHRYNYLYFHSSHLVKWSELIEAYELLRQVKDSGTWGGGGLDWILSKLETAIESRRGPG